MTLPRKSAKNAKATQRMLVLKPPAEDVLVLIGRLVDVKIHPLSPCVKNIPSPSFRQKFAKRRKGERAKGKP